MIDIKTGKTNSILKIDNDKISRPFVLNKSLFVVKDMLLPIRLMFLKLLEKLGRKKVVLDRGPSHPRFDLQNLG